MLGAIPRTQMSFYAQERVCLWQVCPSSPTTNLHLEWQAEEEEMPYSQTPGGKTEVKDDRSSQVLKCNYQNVFGPGLH